MVKGKNSIAFVTNHLYHQREDRNCFLGTIANFVINLELTLRIQVATSFISINLLAKGVPGLDIFQPILKFLDSMKHLSHTVDLISPYHDSFIVFVTQTQADERPE